MNYLLSILTHGADDEPLRATVAAFKEHVSPAPAEVVIFGDGAAAQDRAYALERARPDWDIVLDGFERQRGFCAATRALWEESVVGSLDYVFWLEHDFEVTRPVDLRRLALALDADPMLAQMSLMRDAVNEQERAAGGLFESRRGEYVEQRDGEDCWLEHHMYFTTNPSLMRRVFMADNPWPSHYSEQCEGRFGIDLFARGYKSGVWGSGEVWCRHVGHRDGLGFGY